MSVDVSDRGSSQPSSDAIAETFPLGLHWPTLDPFLFVAHHRDDYPAGTPEMAPVEALDGRAIGSDFSDKDGWSMYHGDSVPGFPAHPHRGFETITYVRRGLIDHSDSLGATARYGRGDTQWLTTGAGVVHSEMFPLVHTDSPNPTELFQIWLNLPARSKFADPNFTMFWADAIPEIVLDGETVLAATGPSHDRGSHDGATPLTRVTAIAGRLPGAGASCDPPSPPPDSWASQGDADVAVWHIQMDPGAGWTLPTAAGPDTKRMLYAFAGDSVELNGERLDAGTGARLADGVAIELVASADDRAGGVELLLLQGRPIGEPVAHYGPFVMNTREELSDAMSDYRRTEFGGWPWPSSGPVHPADRTRFAIHPDGREEHPLIAI